MLRSSDGGAAVTATLVFVFLNYGHAYSLGAESSWGRHRYLLSIALTLILGVVWLARRGSVGSRFSRGANIAVSALVLLLIATALARTAASAESSPPPPPSPIVEPARVPLEPKPDVYYILLDGYARADVLSEIYGYDNRPFLETLEQLGFEVGAHSVANYPTTLTSMASALNMAYLHGEESLLGEVTGLEPLTMQSARTD